MESECEISYTNYSSEELYSKMYSAEQSGAFVAFVRGALCTTVTELFREISSALRFPVYFGWNWAAFDECITDLSWLKFSSLLIIVNDYDIIFSGEKRKDIAKAQLEAHLSIALDDWLSCGIPVEILVNDYCEKEIEDLTYIYFEEQKKDKGERKAKTRSWWPTI